MDQQHHPTAAEDDHLLAALTDAVERSGLTEDAVGAVMAAPAITCGPDDTLERAAQLMWEGVFGCVPVVDADGKPIAMLTDRDICMAAYIQGVPLWKLHVREAMSSRLFVTSPREPLADAERRMRCNGLRRLPVIGDDGRVAGLLSISDIARHAHLGAAPGESPLSASAVAHTVAGFSHAPNGS